MSMGPQRIPSLVKVPEGTRSLMSRPVALILKNE